MKILVLAGTEEARQLCLKMKDIDGIEVVTSLFQETLNPYPGLVITGGFGGVEGLVRFMNHEQVSLLVDATHPFAIKIKLNALEATKITGRDYIRLSRPKWFAKKKDNWQEYTSLLQASKNIPPESRVFAALGSKNLGTIMDELNRSLLQSQIYLRVMKQPSFELPSNWGVMHFHPPISLASEKDLLVNYNITHILCRNSGGKTSRFKLDAAADLGVKVMMVDRPSLVEDGYIFQTYETVEELLAFLTNKGHL